MSIKKIEPSENSPQADNKLIRHLGRQPLFQNTPQNVLALIASQVKTRKLDKDAYLIRKGEPSNSLFIVRTGWVKVVSEDTNGEEVILNHIGPGQIIGEMSLMDRQPRSTSVAALRPVEVMEIEYDALLQVLDQHPALGRSLLQEMFNRVRFANAYVEEAVEWCRHMSDGNYDFVQNQVEETKSTVVDMTKSDQARASAFLAVFFRMVEAVKAREMTLKQEVHRLTIEIDEAKRQQSVQELTDTEFFSELQDAARKIREERDARRPQRPAGDDASS